MKKVIYLILFALNGHAYSQLTTVWPATTTSNATSAGYVGIGTKATSTETTLPSFNLHLHSVTDFIQTFPATTTGTFPNVTIFPGYTVNYGKTIRLGFTNSTTGSLLSDGTVLRQSNNDFVIDNQESSGKLNFRVQGIGMTFSAATKKIWIGSENAFAGYAQLNIVNSLENGLMVHSTSPSTNAGYGIRVKMGNATKNAIEVFEGTGSATEGTRNFSVNGAGQVFARKYTTTLTNIPDYVFNPNYKLMSLDELRTYIQVNSHLPNIPSAKEMEASEVDLGELNRLLLEKTEELTLYILQLEERLKALESSK